MFLDNEEIMMTIVMIENMSNLGYWSFSKYIYQNQILKFDAHGLQTTELQLHMWSIMFLWWMLAMKTNKNTFYQYLFNVTIIYMAVLCELEPQSTEHYPTHSAFVSKNFIIYVFRAAYV